MDRLIIVCDTNVIVSALAFPGGKPDKVIRAAVTGRLVHATSPDVLSEVRRVLSDKLRLGKVHTDKAVAFLGDISRLVYPLERLSIVTADESDNRILECAVAAEASYLVTGDRRHLLPLKRHGSIEIVSPQAFVERVGIL